MRKVRAVPKGTARSFLSNIFHDEVAVSPPASRGFHEKRSTEPVLPLPVHVDRPALPEPFQDCRDISGIFRFQARL